MNRKKENSINPIFDFICEGDPDHQQWNLILRKGKVNRQTKEICPNKIIRMAYNQEDGFFEVDKNGKVVKITTSSEVLISFFASQKLIPSWTNANFTWGWLDEETGLWTGACGLVR